MLRERFAHRHSHTLFGMYPGSRRGETSRRGADIGSSLGAAGRSIMARRSGGAKVVEADGAPLVDSEALHAMIRLFRIVQVLLYVGTRKKSFKMHTDLLFIICLKFLQPLYKGQLQRLLLNLCAHSETRTSLVKILMDLLILEDRKSVV